MKTIEDVAIPSFSAGVEEPDWIKNHRAGLNKPNDGVDHAITYIDSLYEIIKSLRRQPQNIHPSVDRYFYKRRANSEYSYITLSEDHIRYCAGSYADSSWNKELFKMLNNQKELDRINNYRHESWTMADLNEVVFRALRLRIEGGQE